MEKFMYLLIALSGIRICCVNFLNLYRSRKLYVEFVKEGFCPDKMDMECNCEKCKAIADSMTEEELLSDKKEHYHFVKDKLKEEMIDDLSQFVFYSSIVILSIIKYLN